MVPDDTDFNFKLNGRFNSPLILFVIESVLCAL